MLMLFAVLLAASPMEDAFSPLWELDPEATVTDIHDGASFGLWALGAITGFVSHETGHLIANAAFANTPSFVPLTAFGFIPFFAISPQITCFDGSCYKFDGTKFGAGPGGMYTISSAGLDVQHISSEIILSHAPYLRYKVAPYRKGWLAFNVLVSVGYALTSMLDLENGYGDVGGSAAAAGIHHDIYAAIVLVPAALDTYRYFKPDARWAPWVSRGAKAAFIGIAFGI